MFIIEKKVQPSATILFLQVFAKIQHVALILQSQFHNTRCQVHLCYIQHIIFQIYLEMPIVVYRHLILHDHITSNHK